MVAPAIIAAGLTAGGSLLGGLFGSSGAKQGGKMAARATLKAARMNANWQRKFAQKGIRWKVRDARKAGIHPLAALGAQTVSFAPSFVGATQAGQGVADAAASMGQGITRAATALGDGYERYASADYTTKLQNLQLANMELQNAALASQIAQIQQPGNPPAAPSMASRYLIDGQGDSTPKGSSNLVNVAPLTRLASDPDKNYQEAGAVTDKGWLRTQDGWAPVKSKDAMDRMDDDWWGNITHGLRNRIMPAVSGRLQESGPFKLRPGYYWMNNPITDNWWVTDGNGNAVPNYKP